MYLNKHTYLHCIIRKWSEQCGRMSKGKPPLVLTVL